jgi:ParB family chromosome partitioning protein
MGKSKGWFNQRIGLLRLTDEMVQLVLEGKLTAFRDMRRYASMPPEEQYAAWKMDQEQPRPAPLPKPTTEPESAPEAYTAVYTPDASESDAAEPGPRLRAVPPVERSSGPADYHGVIVPETLARTPTPAPVRDEQPPATEPAPPRQQEPTEAIPEPRQHAGTEPPRHPFPYDRPGEAAMLLRKKATVDDLLEMVGILIGVGLELDPDRMHELWQSHAGEKAPNAS